MDFPGVLGGVPGASWARLHAAWDDFAPSRGAEMATEVFLTSASIEHEYTFQLLFRHLAVYFLYRRW